MILHSIDPPRFVASNLTRGSHRDLNPGNSFQSARVSSLSRRKGEATDVSLGPLQFSGNLVNPGGPTSLAYWISRRAAFETVSEPVLKSSVRTCTHHSAF